eukprot:9358091-Ditylum_brightwellii.AAC.1
MKSNRMETAKMCQMVSTASSTNNSVEKGSASSEISDTTFSTYENETFVQSACDENSVASSSDKSEEA